MSPLSLKILQSIDRAGGRTIAELVTEVSRPAAEIEAAVNSLRNARYISQDGERRWRRVESKTGLAVVRDRAERASRTTFETAVGRRKCKRCGIEKAAQAFLAAHEICRQCETSEASCSPRSDVPPPLVIGARPNGAPPAARTVIDDLIARREKLATDYNARRAAIDGAIEQIRNVYGIPEP